MNIDNEDLDVIEGEFEVNNEADISLSDVDEDSGDLEIDEDTDQSGEESDDEITISIDGEKPEDEQDTKAPEWVKNLRKDYKELQREKRELQEKLKVLKAPENKRLELSPKPTLKDADYDEDLFESNLANWYEEKKKFDEQEAAKIAEAEAEKAEWQNKLTKYEDSKKELKVKVKDFDESESLVKDLFSQTQQGIILHGSEDSAIVVLALGKNPSKAKELAAITDPVKFAFAVAKLESKMKVSGRKAPAPEKQIGIKGSKSVVGKVDSKLERLRAEAEKTGDLTKVQAYKRQLKSKN